MPLSQRLARARIGRRWPDGDPVFSLQLSVAGRILDLVWFVLIEVMLSAGKATLLAGLFPVF